MLRPYAFALVALFMIGTGTTFAAEGSLPGNFFYPLKVNVIEPMQGAFAVSSEQKAAFAVELADRRLSEAAQAEPAQTEVAPSPMMFAARSQTSADVEVTAHTGTDIHGEANSRVVRAAEKAEGAIAVLAIKDPNAAAILSARLTATLTAHTDVLESLAASGDERATELVARSAAHAATTTPAKVKKEETKLPLAAPIKNAKPEDGDEPTTSSTTEEHKGESGDSEAIHAQGDTSKAPATISLPPAPPPLPEASI